MQQVLRQFVGESAPKPKHLTDIDQFSKNLLRFDDQS